MREREAPLCRVEEVDEPAKAGGTAQTSRALGFLATEACTPRGVATHLGKHWLNEPSAITRKAGNSNTGDDSSGSTGAVQADLASGIAASSTRSSSRSSSPARWAISPPCA